MARVFLPAVLSGVLLWTAFFPCNLGPVGFFALVPWLSLVRAETSRRRRYLAAYLGGVVFFALSTQWVRVAHPMMYMSWLFLSVVMPITWVLALDFIRRLDRLGVPLALAVPVGWVALEYARMHFPTGFSFLQPLGLQHLIGFGWYFLGYTQHEFLPLIQIADLGGVYAVSFVVAAVNGALAEWIWDVVPRWMWLRWGRPRPLTREEVDRLYPTHPARLPALGVIVLFASSLSYGFVRLSHPEFTPGPRVAAIQGSISQDAKNLGGGLMKTYGDLHVNARAADPKPDLIVWPETCFSVEWHEIGAGETPTEAFVNDTTKIQRYYAKLGFDVPTLLGLNGIVWEGGREWKYNSALLVDATGHKVGRYDKMHLVPFGEYVPLGNILPFMQVFTPYEESYACRPGRLWTRFSLAAGDKQYTFGCLICYEDSDTYLARQYVATEPVDFIVNISNDGWFNGTEEHEQHLAICRFRAIETRRSLVRAVNMGVSGVIDSDGRVIAIPGESWSASKKVEGMVIAAVPLDGRGSLYAVLGDAVPGACWLAVVVSFVLAWRQRRGG